MWYGPCLPLWLAPPRPHPVSFRLLNFKAPNGVQAGKGQPCLIIRLENLRFVREIMRVGIHRSIPILHVLIPSMHSRPVPASAKTTYYWRKHIPRRHAHCGRVDSQVVCSHPRLDMWIRNMYLCHCIFCGRAQVSVANASEIRPVPHPVFHNAHVEHAPRILFWAPGGKRVAVGTSLPSAPSGAGGGDRPAAAHDCSTERPLLPSGEIVPSLIRLAPVFS